MLTPLSVQASSHREAPMISRDPTADNTDLYAFRSPDGSNTVTLVANFIPLEEPAGGPNFNAFDDNVLYELKVDNTGDARADVTYQFRFQTTYVDSDLFGPSFLFNDFVLESINDADLLVRQTYTVRRVVGDTSTVLGSGMVPPTNIGPRSTPSYEANIGSGGRINLSNGGKAFAGPRDDPFFVDLGSIFDLGGLRPFNAAHLAALPTASGIDGVGGYNTHAIAVKIPIRELTGTAGVPAFGSQDAVIGVWATASRQKVTVLKSDGTANLNDGWVPVSRLGNPLINEVIIPTTRKDYWNFQPPHRTRNSRSTTGPRRWPRSYDLRRSNRGRGRPGGTPDEPRRSGGHPAHRAEAAGWDAAHLHRHHAGGHAAAECRHPAVQRRPGDRYRGHVLAAGRPGWRPGRLPERAPVGG